jgi:hypothetical protein
VNQNDLIQLRQYAEENVDRGWPNELFVGSATLIAVMDYYEEVLEGLLDGLR